MSEIRPRVGDLERATRPHPFEPSGRYAPGEQCDLCNLTQRGTWIHPAPPSPESDAEEPRCQFVSPSPWGPAQCCLPVGHDERHAFSPSESSPESEGSGGE